MSNENKTQCECPLSGYCSRHNVQKSNHLHKLCQTHSGYFKLWEECRGPGQDFNTCMDNKKNNESVKVEDTPLANDEKQFPSLFQQAKNFTKAAVKHVASGAKSVDQTLKDKRMEICMSCPLYDAVTQRCRDCGCYLPVKTSWETSTCPKGHW